MPVVLTQHFSASDRIYEDAEYSLYHYPRVYFSRVEAYDRFIYYRPLGKTARRADSLHYFGHGVLGQPFEDSRKPDHRFVPLINAEPFRRFVPMRATSWKQTMSRWWRSDREKIIPLNDSARTLPFLV